MYRSFGTSIPVSKLGLRVTRSGLAHTPRVPPVNVNDPSTGLMRLTRLASQLLRHGNAAAAQCVLADACSKAAAQGLPWGSAWAMRTAIAHSSPLAQSAVKAKPVVVARAEVIGMPMLPAMQHRWPIR